MSKKSDPPKYFNAPSLAEMNAIEEKLDRLKLASRKPRKLKVEQFIPTIVRCLAEGKSARRITAIVKAAHQGNISKDIVLRFAKTQPRSADARNT